MRYSILLFFSGSFFSLCSQTISDVHTKEDADKFVETQAPGAAELVTLTSDKDSTGLSKKLLGLKKGNILMDDGFTYKCIDIKTEASYRVNYIYLDGKKLPERMIDSLRTVIISSYKNGTPFIDLVKKYTMDGNPDGNLGWYAEWMVVKEFNTAVKAHKKGDVFMIDVPKNNWYYVTLKTFDERPLKTSTVLKVKRKS